MFKADSFTHEQLIPWLNLANKTINDYINEHRASKPTFFGSHKVNDCMGTETHIAHVQIWNEVGSTGMFMSVSIHSENYQTRAFHLPEEREQLKAALARVLAE